MNVKKVRITLDIIFFIVLLVADQASKFWAATELKGNPPIVIVQDVFELDYLENRGAAFGMLQNQKFLFVLIAVFILFVIAYIIKNMPSSRKFRIAHVVLVMIAAGAVGNMIDRVMNSYVVDFLSFVYIHFPIFNVADVYVCTATALLVFLLLFNYTETDLNFISLKTQKTRDIR